MSTAARTSAVSSQSKRPRLLEGSRGRDYSHRNQSGEGVLLLTYCEEGRECIIQWWLRSERLIAGHAAREPEWDSGATCRQAAQLPMMELARRDGDATVAIVPSDHDVRFEAAFRRHVIEMADVVAGAQPRGADHPPRGTLERLFRPPYPAASRGRAR